MTLPRCDCVNQCGDDPRLPAGHARPCAGRRAWLNRPIVQQLDRVAKFENKVIVSFQRPLTDDEFARFHSLAADIFK